ncbi:MAG: DMT family transporter [Alphaproteobacteria bacterium]
MPDAGARASHAATPFRAIALICFAVFCFILMNTMVRYLGRAGVPVPEIIWARYLFHLLLIMAFFPRRITTLLVSRRKAMQVFRSVLVLAATVCMFFAVREMPLADAVALSFSAPLFAVGLSVVILRERVGPRRWAAVAVGFAGMLIIVRPGAGTLQWAALLPISMAVLYATYQIVTRMIRAAADPLNALFYTALVGAIVSSFVVPFFWRTPSVVEWLLLLGIGFLGGLGHYAVILAYERAEVSVIAPFAYTELIWATILGFMVFGDVPDRWTFLGAGIIVASGLYVLYRERRFARPPAEAL